MVTSITSFGRSGLYDWMMQRVTAIVLLAYTIFMIGYLLMNPELDYNQWKETVQRYRHAYLYPAGSPVHGGARLDRYVVCFY